MRHIGLSIRSVYRLEPYKSQKDQKVDFAQSGLIDFFSNRTKMQVFYIFIKDHSCRFVDCIRQRLPVCRLSALAPVPSYCLLLLHAHIPVQYVVVRVWWDHIISHHCEMNKKGPSHSAFLLPHFSPSLSLPPSPVLGSSRCYSRVTWRFRR